MNFDTVARIDFQQGVPLPGARFAVQARLVDDGAEHPYGRWSLGALPIATVGDHGLLAKIDFIAPDAPRDELVRGMAIELFRGSKRIGTATVLSARYRAGQDRDILSGAREVPRVAA